MCIVGAGPAGLGAAAILREHGRRASRSSTSSRVPAVRSCGSRRAPSQSSAGCPAKLYDRVKRCLQSMDERTDVDWRLSSSVLGILRPSPSACAPSAAAMSCGSRGRRAASFLRAKTVLVAAGCYERPLAFPGWTLPGVMGAGAIQAFVKSQQFVPGDRFVLVGKSSAAARRRGPVAQRGRERCGGSVHAAESDCAARARPSAGPAALQPSVPGVRADPESSAACRRAGDLRREHSAGRRSGMPSSARRLQCCAPMARRSRSAPGRSTAIALASAMAFSLRRSCRGRRVRQSLAREAGGWLVDHDEWFESSVGESVRRRRNHGRRRRRRRARKRPHCCFRHAASLGPDR